MRICVLLLLALLCAFALTAVPALAHTTVTAGASDVTVTASDPVAHDVTIDPGAIDGTVRVANPADTLSSPDATCAEVAAGSLDCPVSGKVTVTLGDQSDHLTADASPVPVTVDAGGGDDTLAVENGLADDVACGPGADDASDADADDALTDCEETPDTAGPPDTSIVTHPDEDSNDATAEFSFSSSESAAFERSLDDDPFEGCDPTASFPGLADGPHTLRVRAIDRVAKVDTTPAAYAWAVDTQAPTITFSSAPAATNATANFAFHTTDQTAAVNCWLDGARGACASPSATRYDGLGEGQHTVVVRAADAAGNTGTAAHTWSVDLTGPTVSFTAAPAPLTNDATPAFAVAVSEPSSFECSLDAAGFTPCSQYPSFGNLADGPHSLIVRTTDGVGNSTLTGPYAWTQDTVRPQTQLMAGPASSMPVDTPRATFTFTSAEDTRFECSLDSGVWQACTSPATYANLANGTHTFAVRAVDAAGNPDGTPATRTWTVRIDGAPTARIAVTRDGDGFALSAAGSRDPEGRALIYRWLRNGTPAGAGATVHYDAPDRATRDVFTLTVVDPDGQRGQATVVMRTRETTETTEREATEVLRFGAGTRLAAGARARIAALRAAVAAGRASSVRVEGFSRPADDAARVANARAQAVRRLLVKGVSPAPSVTVVGRGAAGAVASNATSAGRARNDRVVVTVRFAGPVVRLLTEQEGNPAVRRSTAPQPRAAASGPAPKLFAFYSAVPGALRRLQEVGSRVDVPSRRTGTRLRRRAPAIHGGRPNAKVMALSRTLGFDVWPVVNATMPRLGADRPLGRAGRRSSTRSRRSRRSTTWTAVTLDMEEMLPRQKSSYSALVEQLPASALHAKRRKLAVYAVRRTATDVDDSAAAYDWTALARAADLVLASGYNEHAATTDAGPGHDAGGLRGARRATPRRRRGRRSPRRSARSATPVDGKSARMLSSADAERRWPVRGGGRQRRRPLRDDGRDPDLLRVRRRTCGRASRPSAAPASRWIGLFTLGREPERFWERSAIR